MKKVLIITYYWPPAGGPGVQRWLKFVKYLPEFGIEPIVYCPQNPNYPIIDNGLSRIVNKSIKVLFFKYGFIVSATALANNVGTAFPICLY